MAEPNDFHPKSLFNTLGTRVYKKHLAKPNQMQGPENLTSDYLDQVLEVEAKKSNLNFDEDGVSVDEWMLDRDDEKMDPNIENWVSYGSRKHQSFESFLFMVNSRPDLKEG